ncbi:hypothetical protein BBW68_00805 [Candidatus Erwinia dacicola]|uniref:Uncharacterized protein n=1 Tax=Candidatus Erwinia dacicola TaxID=252393 RepID=A0A1E7Z4U1_9GAMM|nr:hypothetical protein BBW68_00805 [Candidatus Erwinia dacicola]
MTERLNSTAATLDARAKVTILECALKSGRGFHFCNHPLLSGSNSDLWFPRQEGESLHEAVERVMVMNHQAENVTRLEPVAGVRLENGKYPTLSLFFVQTTIH